MRLISSLDAVVIDDAMDAARIADAHALKTILFHRDFLGAVKQQLESYQPGIYILIGNAKDSLVESLYVGRGTEQVRLRLKDHNKCKDFWNQGIIFPLPTRFKKCYIQYLEARVIDILRERSIIKLENKIMPKVRPIGDAVMIKMDTLITYFFKVLSAVQKLTFIRPSPLIPPKLKLPNGRRKWILSAKGYKAIGYVNNQGITVLRGSKMAVEEVPSLQSSQLWVWENRQELIEHNIVIRDGDYWRFIQNYAFRSPSWAAAAILGRPANGRREWTDARGRELNEFYAPVKRCRRREALPIFRNGIKK